MHWWKLLERPEMFEIWEDVDLTDRYEDVEKFTKEEAEGVSVTKKTCYFLAPLFTPKYLWNEILTYWTCCAHAQDNCLTICFASRLRLR